jgi:hypothetical protein
MATEKNPELDEFRKLVQKTTALKLRSKAVTVGRLLPSIEQLIESGYSHERIVEVMTAAGLEMTVGTFRSYRNRAKAAEPEKEDLSPEPTKSGKPAKRNQRVS